MPTYADPETLTAEGQTIYNAIHAPGAKTHSVKLKWTGGFTVQIYNTEKVLFEVYDAVDEEFTPPAYPENGYVDLEVAGRVKKRLELWPETPSEEPNSQVVTAAEINAKLAEMNAWFLENSADVAKMISP